MGGGVPALLFGGGWTYFFVGGEPLLNGGFARGGGAAREEGSSSSERKGREHSQLHADDGGRMGGFVASLAATMANRGVHGGDPSPAMGYYDGADVPVYDHLAEEFLVCDRWFSSVPGATWPNRLYALCGSAAGSRDDLPPHLPPIYHKPSFVRHLDEHDVSWRWYCFDTPTLRLADARYTAGHHHHFGYFSKTSLSWKTNLSSGSTRRQQASSRTPQAARCRRCPGSTRPSPASTRSASPRTMTTRPPTSATARTSCWPSTPPWRPAPCGTVRCWSSSMTSTGASMITSRRRRRQTMTPRCSAATACGYRRSSCRPGWNRARCRAPSSITPRSSSRSCCASAPRLWSTARQDRSWRLRAFHPHHPGARVAHAAHLGELLTRTAPRPVPLRDPLVTGAAARAAKQANGGHGTAGQAGPGEHEHTDLQKGFLAAAHELARLGHPAGKP